MANSSPVIRWFHEIRKTDLPLAGGKGANLGELVNARVPVPDGFVITANAYFDFLAETGIRADMERLLVAVDGNDTKGLQEASVHVKARIMDSQMPQKIADNIKSAYRKMGKGLVAVRSSATAEDLPEASFAGQQSTYLNIQGDDEVTTAVQKCWASLFESRAIFYRIQQGFDHFKVGVAVVVQKMVQSEASGVMFTVEPLTADENEITIEAVFGLGEAIVSGEVTPDLYILEKPTLKILDKRIAKQVWQTVRNTNGKGGETNLKESLPLARQMLQKISDDKILALAKIGKRIEALYQFPQDIEWAVCDDQLFILQTRPVTTMKLSKLETLPEIKAKPMLTGVAASPGIAFGPVRRITDISQIDAVVKGDVLVTEMTTPDFVPAMKKAVAIVTDKGGRTAHAAIVSRELGIPCVVGTEIATKILEDGLQITVDGSGGRVYKGKVVEEGLAKPQVIPRRRLKTRTKVYVNLAEPELAEMVAAKDVDGVGLLRAEFMIAQIGEHPNLMLSEGRGKKFVEMLSQGLDTFARVFYPRPVVYRTTDFKTNEYRNLRGGDRYEGFEENPMIGYRGCSRYRREIEVFKMELDAIKAVREVHNNLWVMIPFVRFVSEMKEVKEIMESQGLSQDSEFKLWMMCEVPSNVILIDKFIDTGIDGVSIGSNDLTQLILGIDRDSPKLADEFDERNEAVQSAIERVVKTCKNRGITCSICGQAPSVYPEITEKLVQWGITSVSVSPDMIDQTRHIIATVEAKLAKAQ